MNKHLLHRLSPAQILGLTRNLIPPLSDSFYKGQAGRIVVVGGCEDYTGAPYFAALASTLLGADMSHIICERNAATAIKSYSPNLMVHPYLFDSASQKQYAAYGVPTDQESVIQKVLSVIDRVHVVVVGPGLGRDKVLLETTARIIQEVIKRSKPIVIDADGLFLIQQNPDLIKGYQNAILTPNVIELQRLRDAVDLPPYIAKDNVDHILELQKLSELYGDITILEKGKSDFISNATTTVENPTVGGLKRVSGQGDTLSGTISTFLAWKVAFESEGLWPHKQQLTITNQGVPIPLTSKDLFLLAAFGASAITRLSSHKAFKAHGRALVTSQISDFIGESFHELFETGDKPNPNVSL
ncbi:uncharacterized protein SAPINGB_P003086 [Magnusiomyces paraingens]|uniref:ATP-dependent (S)-NAD(P)H-hydrate dehydratase n=1 Tax=Magnusiomyces paraingens TaxID=2606893 RepID=A0A5E8BP06_9ASCO|nr:uncharacterized protein SAPINGB_P003086 [Saprochaete ingens]VVT51408.1 unnamed protein product [Saprochaete ingens]